MAHTSTIPQDIAGAEGILLCFTAGTMIDTPSGERAADRLKVGDLVWTADGGAQPIRWCHHRRISRDAMRRDESLRPVQIAADAFGRGLPLRALRVSPQHRICVSGWRAELFFGAAEVLVAAEQLKNDRTITQPIPGEDVIYVHFLLDGHQIVRSNGLMTESFHPSAAAVNGMDAASRAEVLRLFPDALAADGPFGQTARQVVQNEPARLVA